jgi:hypothetical protein
MRGIEEAADRMEDPIKYLCADAIESVRPRKLDLMGAWVMHRMPFTLPAPVLKYLLRGVKDELTRQMKRTVRVGMERQQRMVPLDGEWHLVGRLVLSGYSAFINDLKVGIQRDRSRVRFHEQQYEHYKQLAEKVPNGEQLTLDQLRGYDEGAAA